MHPVRLHTFCIVFVKALVMGTQHTQTTLLLLSFLDFNYYCSISLHSLVFLQQNVSKHFEKSCLKIGEWQTLCIYGWPLLFAWGKTELCYILNPNCKIKVEYLYSWKNIQTREVFNQEPTVKKLILLSQSSIRELRSTHVSSSPTISSYILLLGLTLKISFISAV